MAAGAQILATEVDRASVKVPISETGMARDRSKGRSLRRGGARVKVRAALVGSRVPDLRRGSARVSIRVRISHMEIEQQSVRVSTHRG